MSWIYIGSTISGSSGSICVWSRRGSVKMRWNNSEICIVMIDSSMIPQISQMRYGMRGMGNIAHVVLKRPTIRSTCIKDPVTLFSVPPFYQHCLTRWCRVTHICVNKLTIICSDNSLSPRRRQAIIWTNAGILLIRPLRTKLSEILIDIHTFHSRKLIWKCRLRNSGHFVAASMC